MDLGNCALTEIPKELQQLTHLKSLNLGSYYWDSKEGEYRESSNSLSENMFPHVIDFSWEKLPNLHTLTLSNTKITDVSTVQHLSKMQKLDLSNTKLTDVSALQHLSNLQQLDLSKNALTYVSDLLMISNKQQRN
ncbi:MAG: leucine-rich repeat domain-containing protein, partial [Cyclobacteriaceae bacterium]